MTLRPSVIGVALALFAAIYAVCFALVLPAYIDEAYTFQLATDPSLVHMLSALRHGADGTQPLFGVFIFAWAKSFGSSEISLRLAGSLFVVLFVWHSAVQLMRRFAPSFVIASLLLVLANEKFIFYAIQARYYGLLLFTFSLAFWSTWELVERPDGSAARRLHHMLVCGLLWLSHPMGMVYAALLAVLYLGFAAQRRTLSLTNALAHMGGPLLFLPWLPSFLIQRRINTVFPPGLEVPGWHKYWEYAFLDSAVYCGLCIMGVLMYAVGRCGWSRMKVASAGGAFPSGLVAFGIVFIVSLNLIVALLDAFGIIDVYLMLAVRYVLVDAIPFALIFCAIFAALDSFLSLRWAAIAPRVVFAACILLALVQMERAGLRWWTRKSAREPYLQRVAQLAGDKHLALICENHMDAFYFATRTSAADVKYLLQEDFPFHTLMLQMYKFYPRPEPVPNTTFETYPRDFAFVPAAREAGIIRREK